MSAPQGPPGGTAGQGACERCKGTRWLNASKLVVPDCGRPEAWRGGGTMRRPQENRAAREEVEMRRAAKAQAIATGAPCPECHHRHPPVSAPQGDERAKATYDAHVHGVCDCPVPNWCLFEIGFKAGRASAESSRERVERERDEAVGVLRALLDAVDPIALDADRSRGGRERHIRRIEEAREYARTFLSSLASGEQQEKTARQEENR